MQPGFATPDGTQRFAARFPSAQSNSFFRTTQDLTVSSIGIGSYLGSMDDSTSQGYREAVVAALRGGVNVIDTSLNYRHQMSERDIGAAVGSLLGSGEVARDEFLVCTKAGFLVPGAVPDPPPAPEDLVERMHCMTPEFLRDQLARSRVNLGLATIDVFYLHNPETQLQPGRLADFDRRCRLAFEALERECAAGHIRFYGMATWTGFRTRRATEGLSIERLAGLASEVAGANHRFRFIQMPVNLAMVEGPVLEREPGGGTARTTLAAAADLGISVVASASILQSRLARNLPEEVTARLPGLETDAQRALQFTRSVHGISVALVGMSKTAHVEENLGVSRVPPALLDPWFRSLRS